MRPPVLMQLMVTLAVFGCLAFSTSAQEPNAQLPSVVATGVPQYPPLAKAARVEGVVHVKITTDGHKVVSANAEDGPKLLRAGAEENAKTWEFASHNPTSFTVKYQYKLTNDPHSNPYGPTITLRLPTDVEVLAVPLVISDPAPDPLPKSEIQKSDPVTLAHESGHVADPPKQP
jgi:hypothetical protein